MRKPRVLLVTDDAAVRRLLSELLDGEGLQLLYADNGGQAIALAARLRPELAVFFAHATRGMSTESGETAGAPSAI